MSRKARTSSPKASARLPWLLIGTLAAAAVLVSFGRWLQLADPLPVEHVEVKGEFRHLNRERLVADVQRQLRGGFLMSDLAAVRQAVERLPWVATASVRRVWPAQLEIEVAERMPLAQWGRDSLVTSSGDVFAPQPPLSTPPSLQLAGPPGTAAEVTAMYGRLTGLLEPAGVQLVWLELNARREWQVRTAAGMEFRLGAERVEQRLRRYLAVAGQIERPGLDPAQVDLRYPHGFAVRWRAAPAAEQGESS
jgi:cell division protein FtsQ